MDITIISKRYAKALFDLAIELKKLEKVSEDIALIQKVIKENPEFRRLLLSPIIPERKKNQVVKGVFEKHLDELTYKFLRLVTLKEREVYLDSIALAFVKLYKNYHNILTITLTSAIKLSDPTKKKLVDLLSLQTKKTIDLIEVEDKSLIGGFVLTMDDQKYDASIKHQLDKLSKTFEKNLYIKGY